MRQKKKQFQSDEPPGAPEWMVTFSDCMTLLLTFFVLLLSFSSFDVADFYKLRIIFAKALPSVNPTVQRDKDAIISSIQIQQPSVELNKGSEKPPLSPGSEAYEKPETKTENFRERKVFLLSSKKMFWGKGVIISRQGRRILAEMAAYLKKMPERIVVTEGTAGDRENSAKLGLPRSWAVIEFLTTKSRMDKNRFSISAQSTLADANPLQDQLNSNKDETERNLEIVLLERSIYN